MIPPSWIGAVIFAAGLMGSAVFPGGEEQTAEVSTLKKMPQQDMIAGRNDQEIDGFWYIASLSCEGNIVMISYLAALPEATPVNPLASFQAQGKSLFEITTEGEIGPKFCDVETDRSQQPWAIDLVRTNGTIKGIYSLDGDHLQICLNAKQGDDRRPTRFDMEEDPPCVVIDYQRHHGAQGRSALRSIAGGQLAQGYARLADQLSKPDDPLPAVEAAKLQDLSKETISKLRAAYERQARSDSNSVESNERMGHFLQRYSLNRNQVLNNLGLLDEWSGKVNSASMIKMIRSSHTEFIESLFEYARRMRARDPGTQETIKMLKEKER